jgi:hypothetical protein
LAFQSLDFERTWWRLFQKRIVCTKFDIYVFIRYIMIKFERHLGIVPLKFRVISRYIHFVFFFQFACGFLKIELRAIDCMLTDFLFKVTHIYACLLVYNIYIIYQQFDIISLRFVFYLHVIFYYLPNIYNLQRIICMLVHVVCLWSRVNLHNIIIILKWLLS